MFVELNTLCLIVFLGGIVLGYIVNSIGQLISSICDYYHYKSERKRKEAYDIRYEEEKGSK